MAESYIGLPADGTGRKLRSFQTTVGANTVEHQALVICDSSGNVVGVTSSRLLVDGSGVTQPVSGTVTVSNPTTAPETGLAKDATLTGGTQKSKLVDTGGTNVASISVAGALKVDNSGVTQPVSGAFFQATQPVSLATAPTTPVTGTFWQATQPVSGTVTADTELPAAGALADATANPTTSIVASPPYTFNGTTWDRFRGNYDTTTGDTGTKTATFAGATQTNYNALGAFILVKLGTVSGTTPTLSCQLQWSYDGGTSWLNVGTALANLTATNNTGAILVYPANSTVAGATPATLTTGATATAYLNMSLPRLWRVNYTIGGTTPSFALTATYVNYSL